MDTFLKIFIVVVLALAFIGWLADRRAAANRSDVTPGLSLLPGDIKYESPNGNVRVYFPIVTSIVISVVLTPDRSLLRLRPRRRTPGGANVQPMARTRVSICQARRRGSECDRAAAVAVGGRRRSWSYGSAADGHRQDGRAGGGPSRRTVCLTNRQKPQDRQAGRLTIRP